MIAKQERKTEKKIAESDLNEFGELIKAIIKKTYELKELFNREVTQSV